MTATEATGTEFNLDDIDIHSMPKYIEHGYPWAEWDYLRENAPVFWYDRPDIAPFWAITRHADVKAIGGDPKSFINSGGRLRIKDLDLDGRYAAARQKKLDTRDWDPEVPEDFIFLDAPEHTEMRMLTARHFTPARCRQMADEMGANAERFTADFRERLDNGETLDLVHDYSVALPLITIASMMGLDPADWEAIHMWTDAMFDLDSMRHAQPGEDRRTMRKRLHAEYHEYICSLVDRKKAEPGDDLSTLLVQATLEDGRPLTEQELHGYLRVLIAAGNETTRNALSRGILAFLENPDQIDRLMDDPDRFVEPAVDEVVRWTTPVIQFARTATRDVEMHGETIKAGDHVGLWYGAANRDPRVFDRPYEFDISRDPNEHLGFGHGGHFCLGANLAKWELRAAFRALAHSDVLTRLEPADQPIWLTDLHVGAYKEAPVRFRP